MSDPISSIVGPSATVLVSDPWDLGESISWKPLGGVVLNVRFQRAHDRVEAGEAILLRLKEPFTFDDARYEYLWGSPRLRGLSLDDLRNIGTRVPFNFLRIDPDRLDKQHPLDASWWRGGGGLIGTLSLVGGMQAFRQLEKLDAVESDVFIRERELLYARREANQAWSTGDYQKVIDEFSLHEDSLRKSERMKLAFARKKLAGGG